MDESQKAAKLDKLTKQIEESFVDSVRASNEELLRNMIINLSKELEEVSDLKKNDPKLNTLKEDVKDLTAGYNDVIKEKKKRVQFVLLTLEERGKL